MSVMALGVGAGVNNQELDGLVTYPSCRHHLSVNSFQDLKYFVQLTQRTICNGQPAYMYIYIYIYIASPCSIGCQYHTREIDVKPDKIKMSIGCRYHTREIDVKPNRMKSVGWWVLGGGCCGCCL